MTQAFVIYLIFFVILIGIIKIGVDGILVIFLIIIIIATVKRSNSFALAGFRDGTLGRCGFLQW